MWLPSPLFSYLDKILGAYWQFAKQDVELAIRELPAESHSILLQWVAPAQILQTKLSDSTDAGIFFYAYMLTFRVHSLKTFTKFWSNEDTRGVAPFVYSEMSVVLCKKSGKLRAHTGLDTVGRGGELKMEGDSRPPSPKCWLISLQNCAISWYPGWTLWNRK